MLRRNRKEWVGGGCIIFHCRLPLFSSHKKVHQRNCWKKKNIYIFLRKTHTLICMSHVQWFSCKDVQTLAHVKSLVVGFDSSTLRWAAPIFIASRMWMFLKAPSPETPRWDCEAAQADPGGTPSSRGSCDLLSDPTSCCSPAVRPTAAQSRWRSSGPRSSAGAAVQVSSWGGGGKSGMRVQLPADAVGEVWADREPRLNQRTPAREIQVTSAIWIPTKKKRKKAKQSKSAHWVSGKKTHMQGFNEVPRRSTLAGGKQTGSCMYVSFHRSKK